MTKRAKIQAEGRAMVRMQREAVAAHIEDMAPRRMRCHVTVHDMGEEFGTCETCCVHGEDITSECYRA